MPDKPTVITRPQKENIRPIEVEKGIDCIKLGCKRSNWIVLNKNQRYIKCVRCGRAFETIFIP